MKRDSLEQAYLAREQMKDQAKGLTESSRAALSAVSGRNILKTKEETAKIKRDREIAAQQTAASVAKAQADQGITLEKTKASQAQQLEHTKRGEIISMLNMGIYDPNFAGTLGMKDSVVKQFAEKKAAEAAAEKAKQKAAQAKAEAEYQEYMRMLEEGENEEKGEVKPANKIYVKPGSPALDDEFVLTQQKIYEAQDVIQAHLLAKRRSENFENLADSYVPKTSEYDALAHLAKIADLKTEEGPYYVWATDRDPNYVWATDRNSQIYAEESLNNKSTKLRDLVKHSAYEETYEATLETLQKRTEKLREAQGRFKTIDFLRRKADGATNRADYEQYSELYETELQNQMKTTFDSAGSAASIIGEKTNDIVEIGVTEHEQIVNAKIDLSAAIAYMRKMEGFSSMNEEGKASIQEMIKSAEALEKYLDYGVSYSLNYDSYKVGVINEKYGAIYGDRTKEEMTNYMVELGTIPGINDHEGMPDEMSIAANVADAHKNFSLPQWVVTYGDLRKFKSEIELYTLSRVKKEGYEDSVKYLKLADGKTLYENFDKLEKYTYDDFKKDGYRWFGKGSQGEEISKEKFEDIKSGSKNAYLTFLNGDWNAIYPDEELTEDIVIPKEKISDDHDGGRKETYLGNYDFEDDVEAFGKGEYWYFTPQEARRVNAIYRDYGADAAFDYYATVWETALIREAKDMSGFEKFWNASQTASFFTNFGAYVYNFFHGEEARIGGTKFSAADSVLREEIKGSFWEGMYEGYQTVADMVPQVVLAYVPYAGAAIARATSAGTTAISYASTALSLSYVGAKSALTNYSAAVAQGKNADEALAYSLMSATSEVVMTKVLSGLGNVGGKYSLNTFFDNGIKRMSANPLLKRTMSLVLSMGGEGVEEALQVVVEPFFEKIANEWMGTGDAELKDIDWDEVVKTFALSAISAGILDGWRVMSSTELGGIKRSSARQMIADNTAIDTIRDAAAYDNRLAHKVKEAFLNEAPRYKNKEGLRAYISPLELMSISSDLARARNESVLERAKQSMETEGVDQRVMRSALKQMRKVLYGEKITISDVKILMRKGECLEILEELTGEELGGRDLHTVRAILRVAAFPGANKRTIQERLKLFQNKFGELDIDTLRREVYYADLLSSTTAGVVYETEAVAEKITDAGREHAQVLEGMMGNTGLRVLVSDRLATNTFPTLGVIAVNTEDLNGDHAESIYQAVGYGAYHLAQDMSQNDGAELRDLILQELEEQIGKEAVASEINKIRQQGAANGLDILEEAAKDELCARMMPEILLKNAEGLAAENPELADKVRKALEGMSSELNREEDGANAVKDMAEGSEQKKNGIEIGGYTENDMQVNARHILNMNSVFDIPSEKLKKSGKRPSEMFSDFFVSVGEVISTDELGDVALAPSSVKSEVRHGITAEKIASIEAIPEVLRKGRVIFCGLKDVSGVERIVVCAPITIGGELYYMGIMIQRDKQNQRLYFHNVISEKEMSSFSEADLLTTGALENDKHLFLHSILQNRLYVNNQKNLVFTQEVVDRLAVALDPYRLAMNAQIDRQGVQRMEERIVDELLSDDEFKYTSSEQVAEENGGADFSKTFDNMTPDEREASLQQMGKDLDELMTEVAAEQRRAEEESTDKQEALRRAEEMTGHSPEKEKRSPGEWVHDVKTEVQYQLTDTGTVVHEIGKEIGDRSLYDSFNMARSAEQAGMMQILEKQTDIYGREIGKGLKEIWAPIMKQGEAYRKAFDNYLLHWHNIDRMSRRNREAIEEARGTVEFYRAQLSPAYKKLSEQDLRIYVKDDPKLYHIDPAEYQATYNDVLLATAEDFQTAKEYVEALDRFNALDRMYNKPVFGWDVDADASRMAIKMLEAEHPEFKQYAEDVWQFVRNLNKNRVDSGLITAELSHQLQEVYPHYVPVIYADEFDSDSKRSVEETAEDLGKEGSGKTVKRAKGGEGRILTIRSQLASQAMSVAREGAINRFGEKLIQAHDENGSLKYVKRIEKREDLSATTETFDLHLDEQDPFAKSDGKKMFSVFLRGVRYDIEVDDRLFAAIESLRPDPRQSGALYRWGQINVTVFKKMITAYNPFFTLRNFAKDMGDAAFTSQSTLRWSKNLPKALYQIIRNGEQYRQYKALGGGYSSFTGVDKVFDEKGTKNPIKWLGAKMEVINQAVEQLPRFAEYLATVEKGNGTLDSLMEAIYNADDITTNFGRAGNLGKKLNRYVIPFFNPAMQGMSKAVRLVTEQPGFKSYLRLAIKAAAIGFAPVLINGLLFGDDDEWEEINQRDKDLYFLWKVSDGCWIKIPKGRLASIVGMTGDRIRQVFSGEDVEWAEFIGTAVEQVAPSNPLTSNIVGPVFLASINRTWWGGEIENERLQQYAPGERYDTKTDELSKWIGSWSGLSPKKINYVLDAYSGVFGDILLPWMSPAAEQGFFEKAFTIDTNYSNRLTGDFYERLDELTWAKNKTDATKVDEVVYRWWNKNSGELSAINKEIRSIEENEEYSASDKEEKVDAQYVARNVALLNFEETYDRYVAAAEKIAKEHPDLDADDLYRETNREVFGAEAAILTYNKEVHARAAKENKENGISFDDFYDIYFDESVDTTYALNMMAEGFVKEDSVEISAALEALEPKAGKETVSYVQKIEAILNTDVSEYEKMRAMAFFGNDTEKRRLAIAFEHGVDAKDYLAVKMNIETIGETKNVAIQAAIDSEKNLDKEHRAILWQLLTGSTSAKNNPYSVKIGNQILKEIDAYKKANE